MRYYIAGTRNFVGGGKTSCREVERHLPGDLGQTERGEWVHNLRRLCSPNSKYFLSCFFSLLATFSIPSSCWSRRRTETSRRPNRIARSREWWTRRDQTRVDNNQCENASFKDSTIPLIGQHCRAQTAAAAKLMQLYIHIQRERESNTVRSATSSQVSAAATAIKDTKHDENKQL